MTGVMPLIIYGKISDLDATSRRYMDYYESLYELTCSFIRATQHCTLLSAPFLSLSPYIQSTVLVDEQCFVSIPPLLCFHYQPKANTEKTMTQSLDFLL